MKEKMPLIGTEEIIKRSKGKPLIVWETHGKNNVEDMNEWDVVICTNVNFQRDATNKYIVLCEENILDKDKYENEKHKDTNF